MSDRKKTLDPAAAFIEASVWHGSLETAAAILTAHPDVAGSSIHTAALLGDDATVQRFLALDPANATAKGGPLGWDALTHLCFSRYLRIDKARSAGFVRAATALLDAGASANTGWIEKNHQPKPEWESVLYAAAGVAHHADLTCLLLERGADPNDEETPYHTPETYDNAALKALLKSDRLTDDSLAMMLLRKADWHDYDGIKLLLERGADPNRITRWATPFHNAVISDNRLEIIELMLDHGADPSLLAHRPSGAPFKGEPSGKSAVAMAARHGRRDLLELFTRRGVSLELAGADRLVAACARDDALAIRAIAEREPQLVRELLTEGGEILAAFAGTGNTSGVGHLLDLGVDVKAPYVAGSGYWDIARNSTALHVAAWRAWPATVKLLIERGAPVDTPDGKGRTPLALAVRACVDSYWSDRRTPGSVEAFLRAGASVRGVGYPSGYADVDELLRQYGAQE